MSHNLLIQKLKLATNPEQKAALVAEAVLSDLPQNVVSAAIRCSFLPWFSEEIVLALLGEGGNQSQVKTIIELPFVEKLTLGYCFHSSTRKGILRKYFLENQSEIQISYEVAERTLQKEINPSPLTMITLLYGYVITNRGLIAEEMLIKILESKKIQGFEIFAELDDAEEFCNLEKVGLTPKYWFYKSQIHLLDGQFNKAINECNNALSLDKNYAHAYSTRGFAKARLGNFDGAIADGNLAVQIHQDEIVLRMRAMINLLSKDYKNAIFDFTRAVREDPTSFLAHLGRAQTYVYMMKPQKSIADLDLALKLSREKEAIALVYFEYAHSLIGTRNWDGALEYLNKVIGIMPSTGIYRRKGDVLFRLSRFEEANQAYDIALDFNEGNSYAHLGKGKILLHNGFFQDSVREFNKALSLSSQYNLAPFNSFDINEAHLRLWEAYILMDDKKGSEEQKEILLKIAENEDQLDEIIFFCRKYKMFEALFEVSLKSINLNKKDKNTGFFSAGYALNFLGKFEDAISYFEKMEDFEDSNPLYYINTGFSYWGLKDFKRAKEHFEQANLDMHQKPSDKDFRSATKSISYFEAEKALVMLMLGNSRGALRTIKSYSWKKNIDLNALYNLRDWGMIINRVAQEKPIGFDEFSQHISDLLNEFGDKEIYKFINGL